MRILDDKTWTKKILYSLLIFWVCGIGPLIYFETFSTHQGVQGYQPVILGQAARSTRLPSELVQALNHHLPQTLNEIVIGNALNLYQTRPFGLYQVLSFWEGHGVLANFSPILFELRLVGSVWMFIVLARLVWLPTPEKPPPFYHYLIRLISLTTSMKPYYR